MLPRGFVRIRHFGLLANSHRHTTIARAQHLLGAAIPTTSSDESAAADVDRARCPLCRQGHWRVVEIFRPLMRTPTPPTADTS